MPKQTFFNLTKEKQERIITAAISEFSEASFNEVKISNIIKRARIPRSSFYDYFEDKEDLYIHIILIIKEEKIKHMNPILEKHQVSFFTKFRELFKTGVKFASMKPEYEKLMNRAYENIKLIENILGVGEIDVSNIYESMLLDGIKNGEIKRDIDVKFVAKSIHILTSNLVIEDIEKEKGIRSEFIEEITDKIVAFIRFGISK